MDAISFGTDGWRATLEEFTTARVQMVGQAVATYLSESDHEGEGVAIGYDARETSRGFAEELARVLAAHGHDIYLSERDCPTPLAAWAILDRELAGALVVTASHNPPEYNGVKFIPEDGAPALPAVTEAIEDRLADPAPPEAVEDGVVHEVEFAEPHADHALELLEAEFANPALENLDVVYDAIHGSGRGRTDALLERAGASVSRLRCERDPAFGGSAPEPSTENLQGLVEAVRATGADLGVANDGDADRIAVVTPERGHLDENLFFGALYDWLLERQSGPAVRSVSTTFLIDRIAEAHGEEVIETPVGFKWVAGAMADADALVGGEESGGFTVRGHVREKDGVLVALLAAAMAVERPIDERVDELLETHGEIQQGKVSIDCPDAEKQRVLADLEAELPASVAGVGVETVNTADGFKILLEDGSWLLARPSGTEPKLRVYAEADSESRVDALIEDGVALLETVL